jgi:hypothetical protein
MAAKSRIAKASAGAVAAAQSRYVQRLIEDEELRQNLVQAFDSARSAYARLSNGKSPTKVVFDDKRFQRDVRTAATLARDASVGLREGRKRKRSGGIFRLLLLLLVGGGTAVAVSEGLRKRVLDLLFGAEEEFEYTSTTTTPPPAAPTPPPSPPGESTSTTIAS